MFPVKHVPDSATTCLQALPGAVLNFRPYPNLASLKGEGGKGTSPWPSRHQVKLFAARSPLLPSEPLPSAASREVCSCAAASQTNHTQGARTTLVNVSLTHIAGSLSAVPTEATWALTSYLVANGMVMPLSGCLANRIGRKNLLQLSTLPHPHSNRPGGHNHQGEPCFERNCNLALQGLRVPGHQKQPRFFLACADAAASHRWRSMTGREFQIALIPDQKRERARGTDDLKILTKIMH